MKKLLSMAVFVLLLLLVGCTIDEALQLKIVGPYVAYIDEAVQLEINTNKKVTWSSDNDSIATIDQSGLVTGITIGEVTITVTLVENPTIFAQRSFSVIDEAAPNNPYNEYFHTKILSIDDQRKTMELLDVPYSAYDDDVKVVQIIDGVQNDISINDLQIGMDNIYIAVNKNTDRIKAILVDGEIGFKNIRVAIRNDISDIANEATLYHDQIIMEISENTEIQTFDGSQKIEIEAGETITINVIDNSIVINYGDKALNTRKRLIIYNTGTITIDSISRGVGNPEYEGLFEVSLVDSKLLLINEVEIEHYLTKVVPSEMPGSFHVEALKSQAIAARTYAYRDIFNKTNIKFGYTVDDSTKSQVYNNQVSNQKTNDAILATKGMIMTYDGEPINAFYYSSSSGLTASAHEVWLTNDDPAEVVPYLIGQNHTYKNGEQLEFDYQNEYSMLNFFKQINLETNDDNSQYHRWRTSMTGEQIMQSLRVNLPSRYSANPDLILTSIGDLWLPRPIRFYYWEELQDIYVAKRGESGVVMELVIVTNYQKFKIVNQYNIRFSIRPRDAGSDVYTDLAYNHNYGYSRYLNNISILYSGFFAIEDNYGMYTFYGGGNGHGVGMSQYGANTLGNKGMDYDHILNSYYKDIEYDDITYNYESSYKDLAAYKEILVNIINN